MLDKAIRELDRERAALQTQEKRTVAEIKKTAKQGQMDAVKVMAKSLIRNRHAVTKMYNLKGQLQAVSLRIQTLKSTQAMADAMKGATKAMGMMNKQMNLPALQRIMMEFDRQNERMEMTSEVMGDAIDDAFEAEDEEEETNTLVSQVLDEIGVNLDVDLVNAPGQKQAVAQAAPAAGVAAEPEAMGAAAGGGGGGPGGSSVEDDLQARLDALRKG
eukprot:jgi/Astpho2/276/Aster-02166